jgi:hypothetical protein
MACLSLPTESPLISAEESLPSFLGGKSLLKCLASIMSDDDSDCNDDHNGDDKGNNNANMSSNNKSNMSKYERIKQSRIDKNKEEKENGNEKVGGPMAENFDFVI